MENPSLTPEAVAFAARVYDAARAGQMDLFEQALPAGLPATMTNEKGDSLVSASNYALMIIYSPSILPTKEQRFTLLYSNSHSINLSIMT